MAENDANTGGQVNTQTGAHTGVDASGMIPKGRFDEVNERMKAAERRLSELASAEEARNRADLEAKGQYDKLKADYEARLSAATEKAAQWDSYQTTRRETLLAGLSDEDKPLADGLPLDKLEALVSRLGKKDDAQRVAPPPAALPGAVGAAGRLTPQQVQDGVRKHGQQFLRDNWSLISG